MDRSLAEAQRTVVELGAELQRALGSGDPEVAATLYRDLRAAEARRDALMAMVFDVGSGEPPESAVESVDDARRPSPRRSTREAVLETLTLLGRPAEIKLVSDVLRARGGPVLAPARFATLRRDEEQSWNSSATRAAYVLPALAADRFTPVRGMLAASSWPLSVRILAPASPRVDLLYAVAAIAQAVRRDEAGGSESPLRALLWRLGRSVPDATTGGLDPERMRTAALAELEQHRAADEEERLAAAERARTQLTPQQQLFGAKPRVIRNRQKEA